MYTDCLDKLAYFVRHKRKALESGFRLDAVGFVKGGVFSPYSFFFFFF